MGEEDEVAWEAVADAIQRRMDFLGLTKAEVIRRSGITFKTLDRYLAGEPIRRADKRRDLIEALEWRHDAIDGLLAGDASPEAMASSTPPQETERSAASMTMDEVAVRRAHRLVEDGSSADFPTAFASVQKYLGHPVYIDAPVEPLTPPVSAEATMGKALETMIRVRNSIHELISRGMPDHREFVEKERALSRAISGLEPILFQEDLREDDDEASRILLLMAEEIAAWGDDLVREAGSGQAERCTLHHHQTSAVSVIPRTYARRVTNYIRGIRDHGVTVALRACGVQEDDREECWG